MYSLANLLEVFCDSQCFIFYFFDFFEHFRLKYWRGGFKCNYFLKIPLKGIRNGL